MKNTGDRTVSILMMFLEDPENSEILTSPDSPLMGMVIPLVAAGIMMIVGIITIATGGVIYAIDWKKEKRRPEY